MSDQTARPRRPELVQAFAHLAGVAAAVDFSGLTKPEDFWLKATRTNSESRSATMTIGTFTP